MEKVWRGDGIVVSLVSFNSQDLIFFSPEKTKQFNHAKCYYKNVDFSSEAVRLGQELETGKDAAHAMHWVQADLRSWSDVSSALKDFTPFEVILDKSTSDAIATGPSEVFTSSGNDDLSSVCPTVRAILDQQGEGKIELSPVELLALHLVPLTQKGAMWITLSYSTARFDNFRYLAEHWSLVSRTPLQAPPGKTASSAYTPEVFHWMYVLQRV
jgi:hypothetical protein